jgi:hypothetical protein
VLDATTCTLTPAITFDPCPLDYPDDSDGDGVCDSDDPCPLGGEFDGACDGVCDCDDGDPCTVDITLPDLTCDNVVEDSDGDGVCDAFDVCPGGAGCDDGDPCTEGDACAGESCVGSPGPDSDFDGACDVIDPCPADSGDLCEEMSGLVAVHDNGNTEAYAACPPGTEVITGFYYQMSNDYSVDDGSCSHRDQIGACDAGGAGCGTPGACNTDGNDEAFAYALCHADPDSWHDIAWVGVRGNDGPTTATCPGGDQVVLGWTLQFSDEHSGEDCFKANQKACEQGAASCATVECNTDGDDEQLVLVGCAPPDSPFFGLSNAQVTGNAAAYTVFCPGGSEIVHGWAIQTVEESPIEPCLKAQNFACPLGAGSCSSADCDTVPGNDESMLYINCYPSAWF